MQSPVTSLTAHRLDTVSFGNVEPGVGQADAFVFGAHHHAGWPVPHVAALHTGDAEGGLHRHALRMHPEHRVLRVGHQDVGQFRIAATGGDAHQVAEELGLRIWVDARIEILEALLKECREFESKVNRGEAKLGEKKVDILPPDPIGELGSGWEKIQREKATSLPVVR